MAKLSKSDFDALNEKVIKYKWEFIRRNENYKKEFKQIIEKIKEWHKISGNDKKFSKKFTLLDRDWTDFRKRWGLYQQDSWAFMDWKMKDAAKCWEPHIHGDLYPSPDKKYEELSLIEKAMFLPSSTEPSIEWVRLMVDRYLRGYKILATDFPEYVGKSLEAITIKINLNFPIKRINRDLEDIVSALKDLRKKNGLEVLEKPQYGAFDDMLIVYDIWHGNKDMTFKQIYQKWKKLPAKAEITMDDEHKTRMILLRAKELIASYYSKT